MSTHLSDSNVLIMGDFNLPDINWDSLSGSSVNSKNFCDFIFNFNLTQLIAHPTHRKGNILDLVISNTPEVVDNLLINKHPSLDTDHFMISFDLKRGHLVPKSCSSEAIPVYSKTDMEGLSNYLLDYDFSSFFNSLDIEQVWAGLCRVIGEAVVRFTPTTARKNQNSPIWFTPQIRHELHRLHTLRRKASGGSFNLRIKNNLARAEEELSTLMDDAKVLYEAKLVSDFAHGSNYKIYHYINQILKRDSLPLSMQFNSRAVSDDKSKAGLFNEYFESVYSECQSLVFPSLYYTCQ